MIKKLGLGGKDTGAVLSEVTNVALMIAQAWACDLSGLTDVRGAACWVRVRQSWVASPLR